MSFKQVAIDNEKFIKELDKYSNDEITMIMSFVDPQVAYVIGHVIGWRSPEALYDR